MADAIVTSANISQAITEVVAASAQSSDVFSIVADQPVIRVGVEDDEGILFSRPVATFFGDSRYIGTGKFERRGGKYPKIEGDVAWSQLTYEVAEHSYVRPIAPRDIQKAGRRGKLMGLLEDRATQDLNTFLLDLASRIGSYIFSAGNWPDADITAVTGATGTNWATAGSNPFADGLAIQENEIRPACGHYADTVNMTHDVLAALRSHEMVGYGLYGTSSAGLVNLPADVLAAGDQMMLAKLAAAWRVKRVKVWGTMSNTANRGTTAVLADQFTDQIWFGCEQGLNGSGMRPEGGGLKTGAGPLSFVRIVGDFTDGRGGIGSNPGADGKPSIPGLVGLQFAESNPPAVNVGAGYFDTLVIPTGQEVTAFLATGMLT